MTNTIYSVRRAFKKLYSNEVRSKYYKDLSWSIRSCLEVISSNCSIKWATVAQLSEWNHVVIIKSLISHLFWLSVIPIFSASFLTISGKASDVNLHYEDVALKQHHSPTEVSFMMNHRYISQALSQLSGNDWVLKNESNSPILFSPNRTLPVTFGNIQGSL